MVRVADEIVDSWHELDQANELDRFEESCYEAIEDNYSSNPILHAFAQTYNRYHLERDHVTAFFKSMRLDLDRHSYDQQGYEEYIYGSAEVIGLMCLHVFVEGNDAQYHELEPGARALGAGFQKVNFLRDIGADGVDLGRSYFPGSSYETFNDSDRDVVIRDIEQDFANARVAIVKLPASSRRGVELAWRFYNDLLDKLKVTPIEQLKSSRIRVSGRRKIILALKVLVPF
jgi:phytoene/squalene synthetase